MSNKGTLVYNTLRPSSSADTFAIVFSNEVRGGLHTYSTIPQRDSIPNERRQEGMFTYVSGRTFYLSGGTTNSNWVETPTNIGNLPTNQFSLYDGIDSNGIGRFKGLSAGSNISIIDGPSGFTISTIGSMAVNLLNDPYDFSIWSSDTLSGATRQAIGNKFNNIDTILNGLTGDTLDSRYVNVTGDTMTGGLIIQPSAGTALTIQSPSGNSVPLLITNELGGDLIRINLNSGNRTFDLRTFYHYMSSNSNLFTDGNALAIPNPNSEILKLNRYLTDISGDRRGFTNETFVNPSANSTANYTGALFYMFAFRNFQHGDVTNIKLENYLREGYVSGITNYTGISIRQILGNGAGFTQHILPNHFYIRTEPNSITTPSAITLTNNYFLHNANNNMFGINKWFLFNEDPTVNSYLNGQLLVGTVTPSAATGLSATFNSGIRVGNISDAASTVGDGGLRWNGSEFQYSNGTSWLSFGSGGGAVLSNDPYDFSIWSGDTVSGATRQAIGNKLNDIDLNFDNYVPKSPNIITVSGGTYNVTSNNFTDILNVTTASAVITLPLLSSVPNGFYVDIAPQNIPTTINAEVGEQIDGVASVSSVGYGYLTIIKLSSAMWRVK